MAENCPKLLDLIPKENQKMGMEELRYGCSSSDDKKLELTLGLPGDMGCFSSKNNNGGVIGCGQEQNHNPWSSIPQQNNSPFLQNHVKYQTCPKQNQGLPVMVKESSQPCSTRISELQTAEEKAFSPPSVNTAVLNSSQKRGAPPVVGWPPIRSFRKNLASSSGKGVSEPQSEIPSKPENQKSTKENNTHKGQFVKINMDGVPIGRKVDLSAYTNYSSLSSSVDKLFRGLLAAQRDSCPGAIDNKEEEQKPITDVLDGSREYTLVYEDNEGDRMLVGDVPWHMFVATVKRLRVLKSSDLPTFNPALCKTLSVESSSKSHDDGGDFDHLIGYALACKYEDDAERSSGYGRICFGSIHEVIDEQGGLEWIGEAKSSYGKALKAARAYRAKEGLSSNMARPLQ